MRFQHVKSNIALMKVLIYADSRCKLPETHPDWVAKVMKSWNKNNETVQSGIGIANEEKSSSGYLYQLVQLFTNNLLLTHTPLGSNCPAGPPYSH